MSSVETLCLHFGEDFAKQTATKENTDIMKATITGTVVKQVSRSPETYRVKWSDNTEFNSAREHFAVLVPNGKVKEPARQPVPDWWLNRARRLQQQAGQDQDRVAASV